MPEVLEHYVKSKEIRIEALDQVDVAGSYANIGLVFKEMGSYHLALDLLEQSLEIFSHALSEANYFVTLLNAGSAPVRPRAGGWGVEDV